MLPQLYLAGFPRFYPLSALRLSLLALIGPDDGGMGRIRPCDFLF